MNSELPHIVPPLEPWLDRPVTISDWIVAQARGGGLTRLLDHVASWGTSDPAWISKATPELIRSQWKSMKALQDTGQCLPLFGVPFAVKDNIDVRGFETTAACPDFAYLPTEDAGVINVLKLAGAIVVGKTNLDQFATGLVGTRSPYGVVPNTFDERYVSGGSSSGSASVVARGLVPFALGTDTAGSGRVPAGLNNIVGLKPTRGALSMRGVVPACRSLDCVSILSLCTEDADLVLQLSAVYDDEDAFSRPAPAPSDLLISGSAPTIAICKEPQWYGSIEHEMAYDEVLQSCKQAGWNLVSTDFSILFELADLLYDGPWVAERYAAIKDFISRPDVQMDSVVFEIINKAQEFSSIDVFEGEYLRRDLTRKIEKQFNQFDAILVPTTPTFPTIQDLVDRPVLENSRLGTYTNFVNFMDWSALAFPAGFRSDGLPFGLTLISTRWQEQKLSKLSRDISPGKARTLGCMSIPYRRTRAEPHLASVNTLVVMAEPHLTESGVKSQLQAMDARFHSTSQAARRYFSDESTSDHTPKLIGKPGLNRNEDQSVAVELWAIPTLSLAKFVRSVSPLVTVLPLELGNKTGAESLILMTPTLDNIKTDTFIHGDEEKVVDASYVEQDSTSRKVKIQKVLIANRGEIAVRIASTLKRLGIQSVSVYSRQDRHSQHVVVADIAFLLEGNTVAETYLSGSQIINIAKTAKAEAIIPGYGFLSENADFAEECEREGFVWLGPTPNQMRTLGLKHLARQLAETCGVPLLPGSGLLPDLDSAMQEAARIGYPVMLKSSAGGGGIGLNKCFSREELQAAFATVSRQGQTYFNDNSVFLERLVEDARHIEVQILGDGHGLVRHVGLRDCTLQRRNQKIIEESPATSVPEEASRDMCKAAIRLASSVRYRSVGTVEFIYDAQAGTFHFLEVNTRLQVEHTVTEALYGLDLVEVMLQIATNDGTLLFKHIPEAEEVCLSGHVIEARIYAETPQNSFRPSTGMISELKFPKNARVDTWITIGTEITSTFDPLLAKIVVRGSDRNATIKGLQEALQETQILGVETNLSYLRAIARWSKFADNQYTTTSLNDFEHSAPMIQVLDAGPLTTVQDYPGRLGMWHVGIPPSGPMDDYSFRLANKIVGNEINAAALECTSIGPTLLFHCQATMAVTGATAEITVDDVLVSMAAPITIHARQVLKVGTAKTGARIYIAIRKGIKVAKVFDSSSTFALGALGGHNGRSLCKDDFVHLCGDELLQKDSRLATHIHPVTFENRWTIRVMNGPHAFPDYFERSDYESLFQSSWKVHYNSNRIGVRLTGPRPRFSKSDGGEAGLHPSNIHDSPYSVGSISFTGDEAVIGTCDGPSLGGFLTFATIITADMWKVGQMKAGDEIKLCPVTIDEAMSVNEELKAAIENLTPLSDEIREPIMVDPIIGKIMCHGREIVCRQSGDAAILLEFGNDHFDMRTSFHIYAFIQHHASTPDSAIKEMTPGVRSVHVRYDSTVPQMSIISLLQRIERSLGPTIPVSAPSRIISIPLVVEHSSTLAAVDRYARTIRPIAPWLPNNIDFLNKINGLSHRDEIANTVLAATFLVLGLGDVFFGAPCAVPLDPRHRLFGTKYSPPRSFTPDGTVGIGGQYLCIYGMDSPGGYQLIGRTVPIWDRWATAKGKSKMWMFEVFDRIRFYTVSEEVLNEARTSGMSDSLVHIEEGALHLEEYEAWVKDTCTEAAELSRSRLQILQASGLVDELRQTYQSKRTHGDDRISVGEGLDKGLLVKTEVAGRCWRCGIEEGCMVEAGEELICVESMKTELKILAPRRGRVLRLLVRVGDTLDTGDGVCLIDVDGGNGSD